MTQSALKNVPFHAAPLSQGIFICDLSGLCTYASSECAALMHLKAEDIVGQFWFRCLEISDRKRAISLWESELQLATGFSFEGKLHHSDQHSKFRIQVQATIVPGLNGQPASCVGVVTSPDQASGWYEDDSRYERLREALDAVQRTEHEAVKLYAALNEAEATVTSQNDALEAAKRRIQELTNSLNELSNQRRILDEQLGTSNSAKFALEKEIQFLKEAQSLEVSEYQARINEARTPLIAQIDELKAKRALVEDELKTSTAKIQSLQDEIKNLHHTHKADSDAAHFIQQELTGRLQSLEQLLEKEKNSARSQIQAKEREMQDVKKELDAQLLKMLSEASDLLNVNRELQNRISHLEQKLTEEAALQNTQREEQKREKLLLSDAHHLQIRGLEAELKASNDLKNSISEKLSELERQRDLDLASIEKQRRHIEELEIQLRGARRSNEDLQVHLADSQRAIKAITSENLAEEDCKKKSINELEESRRTIESLVSRSAELEELIRAISHERDLLEKQSKQTLAGDKPVLRALEQIQRLQHKLNTDSSVTFGKLPLTPEQSQQTSKLKADAENLQRLMTLVQEVFQSHAGIRKLNLQTCSPKTILSPLLGRLEFYASQRDVHFESTISGSLNEAVSTDPSFIDLVVSSLLTNLIERAPAGASLAIQIELARSAKSDSQLHIAIEAQDFPEDPQFQEELRAATQSIQHGPFLGLSLAIHLAGNLIQIIDVHSEPHGFTLRFDLNLDENNTGLPTSPHTQQVTAAPPLPQSAPAEPSPIAAPAENRTSQATPPASTEENRDTQVLTALADPLRLTPQHEVKRESSAPKATNGLKALVAEDNGISQRAIKSVLEGYGVEVVIAINGRDAVEKFERDVYDFILMDTQMPQVDGLQATSLIRAVETKKKQAPIIILGMSAHIDETLKSKCTNAGMSDLLSKPLHNTRLDQLIRELLHTKRLTA
jgi:CheY-like chemotaxis protein